MTESKGYIKMMLKKLHLLQFKNFHPLTPIMGQEIKMIINQSIKRTATLLKIMKKLHIHQSDTVQEK